MVSANSDRMEIVSLVANVNVNLLNEQILQFKPKAACLAGGYDGCKVVSGTEIFYGKEGVFQCITDECDIVFVAVTGFVGLEIVLDAVKKKKDVALANKEALVVGGEIVMKAAEKNGVKIIPVDSEHSALWQCLNYSKSGYDKLILTASGGPFRNFTDEQLKAVTPAQALKHPNWNMGEKITIDCATLLNKGFEVIEAHHLFNAPLNKIEVVIHPQSVIHSMVRFSDNSVMAEMSYPSMLQPIQIALTYPNKIPCAIPPVDFTSLGKLEFFAVDEKKFPCFGLSLKAANEGGTLPCMLNAASEVAVKAFLKGQIRFTDISNVIERVMEKQGRKEVSLEELIFIDGESRKIATDIIKTCYVQ